MQLVAVPLLLQSVESIHCFTVMLCSSLFIYADPFQNKISCFHDSSTSKVLTLKPFCNECSVVQSGSLS